MTAYQYQVPRDPTAVMGRRIGAYIVDTLLITIPLLLVASSELEYLENSQVAGSTDSFCDRFLEANNGVCFALGDRTYFTDSFSAAPSLVALGLSVGLLVILQGLAGFTPGKLLFGVRTVGEDGRPPGIGRAIIRWLLLIVDTAPWCFPLVGLITGLSSTGHRRVGDMAAKTFVVGKGDAGHGPIAVPGMATSAQPGYPGGYGGYPSPGGPPGQGGYPAPGGYGQGQPAPVGQAWPGAEQQHAGPTRPPEPGTDGGAWGTPPSHDWAPPAAFPPPGGTTDPAQPAQQSPAAPSWPAPTTPEQAPAAPSWPAPTPEPAEQTPPATAWPAPASEPAEPAQPTEPAEQTPPATASPAPAGEPEPAEPAEQSQPATGWPAPSTDPVGPTVDQGTEADEAPAPTDAAAAPSWAAPGPDPDFARPVGDPHGPDTTAPSWPAPSAEPSSPATPEADATEAFSPQPVTEPDAAEPAANDAPDSATTEAPAPETPSDATEVLGTGGTAQSGETMIFQTPAAAAQPPQDAGGAAPPPAGGPAAGTPPPPQYEPQWDAARNTYIVWEPNRGQWLGWDNNQQQWTPL